MDGGERWGGLLVVPRCSVEAASRRGERAETLPGLRDRLRRAFAPGLEIADPLAVRVALATIAPAAVADDPWLGPIAKRGGRAWQRLVDALDEAIGVVVGREDALEAVSRGTDAAALRARLLQRIVRAHGQSLQHAGLLDPRREPEALADHIAHGDAERVVEILGARDVLARGIVEWTVPDLALWRVLDACLTRVGGRATLELPVLDRPLDGGRLRDPLDIVIEAVAAALDDAPLAEPIPSPLGDLRMTREQGPPTGMSVEVRRADGRAAHGRAVADAVHAAVQGGAAPEAIVIAIVSDDDASVQAIQRSLDELGVVAVDMRPSPPLRSNLSTFAMGLLEVAAHGAPRLEVARVLRSSYVDARRLAGDEDGATAAQSVRALARCLEETPTVKGDAPGDHLRATVAASIALHGGGDVLADLAGRLGRALSELATSASRAEHARRFRALHTLLGLAPLPLGAASGADDRMAHEDRVARVRDRDAWGALSSALERHERVASRLGLTRTEVPFDAFCHELSLAVATRTSTTPLATGAVRIVRFEDLVPEDAALVLVADADADAWPEARRRARLVPASLEARMFRVTDPALQPLAMAGGAEVLARLSLGTSRARRVVFAYRAQGDDGATLLPAPVVEWLSRGVGVSAWSATTPLTTPLRSDAERHAPPLLDIARRATRERLREETFNHRLADSHPLAPTLPRGPTFLPILAEETGGGDRPLSASAVDRLAACVFKGFVTEVLRPKRRAAVHDVADAREEGIVTHAGLEAAFKATSSLWAARPRNRVEILRLGTEAADAAIERARVASELGRSVAARAHAAAVAVLEWSLADEEWDFARAEQAFGEGGEWPPLVLEGAGTRVALRGRIDRIDVAHEGSAVRVVDYKPRASSAELHTTRFGTTTFQIALYGRAARDGLERAEGLGLYLATQRLRPGAATKKQLERWASAHATEDGVARFERTVLDRVDELRSGRIEARPHSDASCEHCDFDGVCRKPRFAKSVVGEDEVASEDDES